MTSQNQLSVNFDFHRVKSFTFIKIKNQLGLPAKSNDKTTNTNHNFCGISVNVKRLIKITSANTDQCNFDNENFLSMSRSLQRQNEPNCDDQKCKNTARTMVVNQWQKT